jgi:SAM-dependent MidA family methyltransferase
MTGTEAILDKHLRTCCANGPISYCDYIEQVLYAKNCGYYTSERERVGRTPQRDFYTAESLGPVFANLVIAAVQDILGEATVRQSQFIEIAAEPGAELLTYVDSNPFAGNRTIRPGQALTAEGPVVLFANEWLDALPFHRLIFRDRLLARARGYHPARPFHRSLARRTHPPSCRLPRSIAPAGRRRL